MCRLNPTEKRILEASLGAADDIVVAAHLQTNVNKVRVYKTRIRRKEANAKNLLRELKKYKSVLHPEKHYKGVHA